MTQNKIGLSQLNILTTVASLNFPSINSNGGTQSLSTTVTGAVIGDYATVTPKTASSMANGVVFEAYVSALNTVTVVATNCTPGNYDPALEDYFIIVFKPS